MRGNLNIRMPPFTQPPSSPTSTGATMAFVPSFTSFPDFDAAPSASSSRPKYTEGPHTQDQNPHRKHRDRAEDRNSRSRREGDKHRVESDRTRRPRRERDSHRDEKRRSRSRSPSRLDLALSDLRQKEREDRERGRVPESSNSIFYSDRKGDPLNITYGGLYAGSVPKYRLQARKSILDVDADN